MIFWLLPLRRPDFYRIFRGLQKLKTPVNMTWKSLLLCFFSALLFTACLEEDSGFGDMLLTSDFNPTGVPSVAILEGKGLPQEVEIQVVTFFDDKGDVVLEQHTHIGMEFRACDEGWCKARVDDCGIANRIKYSYEENDAEKLMKFTDFNSSPAVRDWAIEGAPFKFERENAKASLTCESCPGRTADGTEFVGRRVDLRVIR